MYYNEQRTKFIQYTKASLIGNREDVSVIQQKPLERYFTGFLFPILKTEEGFDIDDEQCEIDDAKVEAKPQKRRKRYVPPSSAGFSFYVIGENINLVIFYRAASYVNLDLVRLNSWEKAHLVSDSKQKINFTPNGVQQHEIFDHKARIDAIWRKYDKGYIVTLSISNTQQLTPDSDAKKFIQEQNEKTFFEVEFKCTIEEGCVGIYPTKDQELLSEEEKEIELRYKDLHTYAIGHGAAVNWITHNDGKMELEVDFMPVVEVPQVTADTGGRESKVLEFEFLSNCNSNTNTNTSTNTGNLVVDKLECFVDAYESWIKEQDKIADSEDINDVNVAKRIVERQQIAKKRMYKGIELLREDEKARIAFGFANKAMLLQMQAGDKNAGKIIEQSKYKWRPFQLAFLLMIIESVTDENSEYRDLLDLIWFPTGGGKTEAYLGLMSFLFIYRRLTSPSSYSGTVSIMRYTLRLLTAQQFERACKVIFALELIRQKHEKLLHKQPFTVGLWVGSASSPNSFDDAKKMVANEQFNKLILTNCPWCNSKFERQNLVSSKTKFHFTCTNSNCDFGMQKNNILPCNIVDEALYVNPPSLLIATVDKFARLAWEEKAGNFFGVNGNRPPELIIQDELHLISSALGSIVGLYEVALDVILRLRGVRAKFIASTATIKNAAKQIQTLFARDMAIFPPSGLRYDDSYFAKTVPLTEKPGRIYVGYMAPLLSRRNCLEPLAATLLAAPQKLFGDDNELLDAWWTQVVYHGSLKGVGNSRTLFQSGVKNYLKKFSEENLMHALEEIDQGLSSKETLLKAIDNDSLDSISKLQHDKIDPEIIKLLKHYIPKRTLTVKTLTSNQSAEENAKVFERLTKQKGDNVVDVALATNMISVGLDVSRLSLMIIDGQPLTTAEYIQASSRIGRGKIPGIVFMNYYKTQARSLSHYENFRSYHDSFYRYVEPSSLTPFTYQARTRALHAVLVIAMRYSGISDLNLMANSDAGKFRLEDNRVQQIIEAIKERCSSAIGSNQNAINKTCEHLNELANQWENEREYCDTCKLKLVYNSKDRSSNNLICNFDDQNGTWQTLQSMRNVENSSLVRLMKSL